MLVNLYNNLGKSIFILFIILLYQSQYVIAKPLVSSEQTPITFKHDDLSFNITSCELDGTELIISGKVKNTGNKTLTLILTRNRIIGSGGAIYTNTGDVYGISNIELGSNSCGGNYREVSQAIPSGISLNFKFIVKNISSNFNEISSFSFDTRYAIVGVYNSSKSKDHNIKNISIGYNSKSTDISSITNENKVIASTTNPIIFKHDDLVFNIISCELEGNELIFSGKVKNTGAKTLTLILNRRSITGQAVGIYTNLGDVYEISYIELGNDDCGGNYYNAYQTMPSGVTLNFKFIAKSVPSNISEVSSFNFDTQYNIVGDSRYSHKKNQSIQNILIGNSFISQSTNTQENVLQNNRGTYNSPQVSSNVTLPEIEIISPLTDSEYVDQLQKIDFKVTNSNSVSIENLEVVVNGVKSNDVSDFNIDGNNGSFRVRLNSRGSCNLSIRLKANGGYIESNVISLIHRNIETKPSLNVLAIGISNYLNDNIDDLNYAAKDASDFINTLKKTSEGVFDKIKYKLLVNDKANRDSIINNLTWLERESRQDDISIIYFAGHGEIDNRNKFYLLPYDAKPNMIRASCLSDTEIRSTTDNILEISSKAIVFIDACYSGAFNTTRSVSQENFLNELKSTESGAYYVFSSTKGQKSEEIGEWENGIFTEALLKGMDGYADKNNDHTVSIMELIDYTSNNVKKLSNNDQKVTYNIDKGNDFPLIYIHKIE